MWGLNRQSLENSLHWFAMRLISGILDKNPQIKELLNAGHAYTLVFSRVRDGKKMAVIKMSPDVRNAIASSGNHVSLV